VPSRSGCGSGDFAASRSAWALHAQQTVWPPVSNLAKPVDRLAAELSSRAIAGILVLAVSGCLSIDDGRRQFKEEMALLVGQSIDLARGRLTSSHELDSKTTEFLYQSGDKCSWAMEIERDSEIIRSWHYVSDPAHCYYSTSWWGAW
jgi:hypothetical protein